MGLPVIINGRRYLCRGVIRTMMPQAIRQGEQIGVAIEGEI